MSASVGVMYTCRHPREEATYTLDFDESKYVEQYAHHKNPNAVIPAILVTSTKLSTSSFLRY